MEIRKISRRRPRSVDDAEFGHFTLLFCRRTAKKCTKIYNARAQLLFCSLNLLYGDVRRCRRRRGLLKLPNSRLAIFQFSFKEHDTTTRHDTTQHDTTRHNTTQHNTTQHDTTQHNKTRHNATQQNTTRHDTTLHDTTQHDTTQHNTTQHDTTRHSITQHNTTQ